MRTDKSCHVYGLPDPFVCNIVKHCRLSPLKFAIFLELFVVLTFLIMFATDYLFNNSTSYTALFTHLCSWQTIIYAFIVTPVVPAFAIWISKAGPECLESVILNNLEIDEVKKTTLFVDVQKFFKSHRWWKASLVVSCVAMVINYFLLTHKSEVYIVGGLVTFKSYKQLILPFYISIPVTIIAWYLLCILISTQICVVRALHYLFSRTLAKIEPLHPDKCGGLYALSSYALRFVYCTAFCGLGITILAYNSLKAGAFFNDVLIQIGLLAYIVLAPVCFFGTLNSAHKAMKRAKNELLSEISVRFNFAIRNIRNIVTDGQEDLEPFFKEINHFKTLHDIGSKFQVWPYDVSSIRRFLTAILSPLIPLVYEFIKNIVPSFTGA